MTASIEVPGHYGHSHVQAVQLTLTMVSRLTAWLNAGQGADTLPRRRLDTAEWASLLDASADKQRPDQGLDGRLRPVPGVLPAVTAAQAAGFGAVALAAQDAGATPVPRIRVLPAGHLATLAAWLRDTPGGNSA